jgi:hypothetical protein
MGAIKQYGPLVGRILLAVIMLYVVVYGSGPMGTDKGA